MAIGSSARNHIHVTYDRVPGQLIGYNCSVSSVFAQAPSRNRVSATSKRLMCRNRTPPNERTMFVNSRALTLKTSSRPRSGGSKGGMSVDSSGSSTHWDPSFPWKVRLSRFWNEPMKKMICWQDAVGDSRVRERTVGVKWPKNL